MLITEITWTPIDVIAVISIFRLTPAAATQTPPSIMFELDLLIAIRRWLQFLQHLYEYQAVMLIVIS